MSVVRTIVGWVTPLVILGAGIAIFLSMGSQPPPERKAAPVAAVAACLRHRAAPSRLAGLRPHERLARTAARLNAWPKRRAASSRTGA